MMQQRMRNGMGKYLVFAGALTVLLLSACTKNTEYSNETVAEDVPRQDLERQQPGEETQEDVFEDHLDRSQDGLTLVWNDEFDSDTLDTAKWAFQYGTGSEYGLDGWGNSELQYYTDREDNVRIEDGKLIITAVKEEKPYQGMSYTSARLRTVTDDETLFSTTYGRIEARIRMPRGEGLWPAFWMLPVDETIYGGWAASGEIDIMEAKGRLPERIGGTLHYGKVWPNNTYKTQDYSFPEGTDITDFHVYSLEWEPGVMRWYVDEECYFTMDKWFSQGKEGAAEYTRPAPYDVPFYILLNLAVGGTFDPEADVELAEFPASMEVDFVRVYQKADGYQPVAVDAAAIDTRDQEGFSAYAAAYTDGEFMSDPDFDTMNTEAIRNTDKDIAADSKDWQFAVGNFGGAAGAQVEELAEGKFARVDITSGGNQNYAVQLIQHFPVIEGYTYEITFDAKADNARNFVLSPSGDADNAWVKYGVFDVSLDTELKSYTYTFKMNSPTDPTARLEFNMGLAEGSVWIGNVSVKAVLEEGGVDPDKTKTPVYGGNLIYNGTFDQGADRVVFWHTEGAEAEVPDFTLTESGEKDYSRMAELTAGENAKLFQKGIRLAADGEFYLRFDLKGEQDVSVGVRVTNEDGTVRYLEETVEYKAADGLKRFEFHFTGPAGEEESFGVFEISLPDGGKILLDNIKMNKKL